MMTDLILLRYKLPGLSERQLPSLSPILRNRELTYEKWDVSIFYFGMQPKVERT